MPTYLGQQIKHRKQLADGLMQTVLREAFEYQTNVGGIHELPLPELLGRSRF